MSPTRVQGIDVSHWNGEGDWRQAIEAGAGFAYIRAGSITALTGELYSDHLFEEHSAAAKAAGMPYGHYFYFRPVHDGISQADYFIRLMQQCPGSLDPWIDVEAAGKDPYQARDEVRACVLTLASAGYKPMIYTAQSFWDVNVAASSLWAELPLVAARYNSAITDPWSDGRFVFRDWKEWTIWQYEAAGNGRATEFGFPGFPQGDNDLDLNWFNGDAAAFAQRFGVQPARILPSVGLMTVKVVASTLNVRNAPGGTDLGDVKPGLLFYVYEQQFYGQHNWARIGANAWIAVGPGLAVIETQW